MSDAVRDRDGDDQRDGETDRLGVSTAVETAKKRTANSLWQVCSKMFSRPVTRIEQRLPYRCQMCFCRSRRRLVAALNLVAERIWPEVDDAE